MQYNPTTDRAVSLEALAERSRAIITRLPAPAPSGRTWNPQTLTYDCK